MKKEYRRDTDSTLVSFEAGRVCDDFGHPTPYWRCSVTYTWSHYRHAYWIYSIQTVGFGVVNDKVTHEAEMGSLRDVRRYLIYLQGMETCNQKVYGV